EVRAGVVDAEAREDRVEVAVEVGAVETLEAELARPLLAHPRLRLQRVRPVDDRAAAQRGAGEQRDVEVAGRRRAAAPVEVREGLELELREVRLIVVAARLEDEDLQARPGERGGDDAAARAGADDDGVR